MNNSPVSSWKMAFLFINFPKYFYDFFLFSFFLKNKKKKKKKGKKKKKFLSGCCVASKMEFLLFVHSSLFSSLVSASAAP